MHGPLNVKVFNGFMIRILLNYHSATVVMMIQYSDVDIQLQPNTNSRSTLLLRPYLSENFAHKALTIALNYKKCGFFATSI
jgi:hypothetical protein